MAHETDPHLVARLAQAFAHLPEQQREIFSAVRRNGASYADIAACLGISVLEVQTQFAAALVALVRAADGG